MNQHWMVTIDDDPIMPARPLELDEVIDHFRDQAVMADPDHRVEIRVYEPPQ